MDEAEARAKWCPMTLTACARIAVNRATVGALRHEADQVITDTRCIASDCMMWRWDVAFEKNGRISESPPTEGRCGLAD